MGLCPNLSLSGNITIHRYRHEENHTVELKMNHEDLCIYFFPKLRLGMMYY